MKAPLPAMNLDTQAESPRRDTLQSDHLWRGLRVMLTLLAMQGAALGSALSDFVWPTPMPVLETGMQPEDFGQPTASGDPESARFGCVRSNGLRFHEGIDIKPLERDRRGRPEDRIVAAMDGRIVYVNRLAGESSYGRYVVIEHPGQTPAVHTLYAHLGDIPAAIRPGLSVGKGQEIGRMGNTAGGYAIPMVRAHLHFEIGLRLSDRFQAWYDAKRFGSKNRHGVWNGMNLIGLDPWDYLQERKEGRITQVAEYLRESKTVVKIRVHSSVTPDFIKRYPSLEVPGRRSLATAWDISINEYGVPFRWQRVPAAQVGLGGGKLIEIIEADRSLAQKNRCKDLVQWKHGSPQADRDLQDLVWLLFGVRP